MRFREKPIFRGVGAEDVHDPRTPVVISSPAYSISLSDKSYNFARNSILTVILLAMLTMVGFTLFNFIATPEFLVKRKISSITSDYYENYYYDSVPDHEALDLYKERGLASISLRQLLLYSDKKHADSLNFFAEYCNLDETSIKIFPYAPYGRKNYHADYTYSCKF